MKEYSGKSAFGGIAVGEIRLYKRNTAKIRRRHVDNPQEEIARFHRAAVVAKEQLSALKRKAEREVGEANAAIFEIHRMMLDDPDYIQAVENCITAQSVNAEYAVENAGDNFAKMFSAMDDEYMQGRAADVRDISERLESILAGAMEPDAPSAGSAIIAADDLAPSETVRLDKSRILAFVTVGGSVNSHTAILARTMNIPAVVGANIPLDGSLNCKTAVVDGYSGKIYIDPDPQTLEWANMRKKKDAERRELLLRLKGRENVSADGKKILLYANIGNINDLASVLENDAHGIGLFRSEFIYLESTHFPTEEEQFAIYKTAAETMADKRVIIRTLDIGADKQADYFNLEREENPAMGLRAIRICLSRPEIFKTQLKALFRASVYGNIAIMYPMITSVSEILEIKAIERQVQCELHSRGVPFGNPQRGIMVETPAAAVISDLLAPHVDFFSIGTNDLSQYCLAIDRQNTKLDPFFDPHHTAVLRLIKTTVDNAHRYGKWCGICGEIGSDLALTPLFLAMGVDELSVSPAKILPVREKIIETNVDEIRNRALEVLKDGLATVPSEPMQLTIDN